MKQSTLAILADLPARYPALAECAQDLALAARLIVDAYRLGGKLLLCGNGGSASDAMHIVGELMKSFALPRPISAEARAALHARCDGERARYLSERLQGALPAISLVTEASLMTAYANDVAPNLVFAQQVLGYGRAGDVLVALSTSGNSKNVLEAARVARALDLRVVALTGRTGGAVAALADACVRAPAEETFRVQEYHLPIYHALCLAVENEFFGGE